MTFTLIVSQAPLNLLSLANKCKYQNHLGHVFYLEPPVILGT